MTDQMNSESEGMNDEEAPCSSTSAVKTKKTVEDDSKRYKKGIVYLSFIPPGMNVQMLSHLLSKYGELGRMMLQPAKSSSHGKKNKNPKQQIFTEGWVEFLKKKVAKRVAASLNNTKIGGKKKSKFHDYLWNIKYLSRFKWIHLSERITYERAVFKQRMNTEINQAKKLASHFIDKVDAAEKLEKLKSRRKNSNKEVVEKDWQLSQFFKQKEPNITKASKQKKSKSREEFLKNIFPQR